jgi:alcohol dehydrogenase
MDDIKTAYSLIKGFKGDEYSFGLDCLENIPDHIRDFGDNTFLVISESDWAKPLKKKILSLLKVSKINIIGYMDTCPPNSPSDSVIELARVLEEKRPSTLTCVGGGSAIDCAKCANVLFSLFPGGNDIERFFGVGKVTEIMKKNKKDLLPFIAVQVTSGSGSHLTKYSNITMTDTLQKKLINDEAVIPDRAVFDYLNTKTMPLDLTLDGALDGLSHSIESYFGSKGTDEELFEKVCLTSIRLIIDNLPSLATDLNNVRLRETIGLATDLGGYAIMIGSTNGPHLNSFSMVDILSHGRACAILQPYYTVFFAPSIRDKIIKLIKIYSKYLKEDLSGIDIDNTSSRVLGETLAEAMINFSKKIGFPTKLDEVKGYNDAHHNKALEAAKNPQLEMKLKGMHVSLDPRYIDDYMGRILRAARTGDFSLIKNL